ncbi:MAG: endonuclease/exonuclease/phosphatase family protein [Gemmatimonadales bacterium]
MKATLRIATYNVCHGRRLDRAVAVAREEPGLADADVLALQECDEPAAERFATALGMDYVYVPGPTHYWTRRHFAPALLSRWPIENGRSVELPHHGIWRLPRTAVAATVLVRGQPVSAYAVHFGNMREILPAQQSAQVRTLLRDASGVVPAIVAGDLNRKGLGVLFEAQGWRWLTRDVGPTHLFWSFDHVFVRGFNGGSIRAGSVAAALAASDHRAVWAEMLEAGAAILGDTPPG